MSLLVIVIVVPLAILDLAFPRAALRSWSERLAARAQNTSAFQSLPTRHSARIRRWVAGDENRSLFGARPLAAGILGALTASALVLGLGAWALGDGRILAHAVRHFAAPGLVVGSLAVVSTYAVIMLTAKPRSVFAGLGLPILLIGFGVVAWLVLMHAGTWLEWQTKRTPVAWGSEWFYAEAYLEYLREPAGRVISIAAAVLVLGLAAWWAGGVVLGLVAALLPNSGCAILSIYAHLPPGVIAGGGLLLWLILGRGW